MENIFNLLKTAKWEEALAIARKNPKILQEKDEAGHNAIYLALLAHAGEEAKALAELLEDGAEILSGKDDKGETYTIYKLNGPNFKAESLSDTITGLTLDHLYTYLLNKKNVQFH